MNSRSIRGHTLTLACQTGLHITAHLYLPSPETTTTTKQPKIRIYTNTHNTVPASRQATNYIPERFWLNNSGRGRHTLTGGCGMLNVMD